MLSKSQDPRESEAEVVAHLDGLRLLVRLEDGRELVAAIPRRIARQMFRVVPGDWVRVAGAGGPKSTVLG